MHFQLSLTFCLYMVTSTALPLFRVIQEDVATQQEQVKDWLIKYGYLEASLTKVNQTDAIFHDALSEMQIFHKIPGTGEIDNEIIKTIRMPRCGFPDTMGGVARFHDATSGVEANRRAHARHRRYLLSGSKWDRKRITYRFRNFSPDMSSTEQHNSFQEAVRKWTTVTNIAVLAETSSARSDIQILFAVGDHNDPNKFDGTGGTLAHAYFPDDARFGGDIHFDDDEQFSVRDGASGVDFFFVALHELGHSLGLDHSSNPRSIMSPIYRGFSSKISLHADDVEAIQGLYGVKVGYDPSPNDQGPIVVEVDDGHSPCTITYDAIVRTGSDVYFFKDEMVWQTDFEYQPRGYGTSISNRWSGGPDRVDAALMKPDGSVVLFSGDRRWEYFPDSLRLKPDYPRRNEELGSLPNSVDAAVYVEVFRIILVFKDALYWPLDPSTLRVLAGNASVTSLNIPAPLSTAFSTLNELFFLTATTDFYVFDATTFKPLAGYPKNFNTEVAGELCGWCETYKTEDEASTISTGPVNRSHKYEAHAVSIIVALCLWPLIAGWPAG